MSSTIAIPDDNTADDNTPDDNTTASIRYHYMDNLRAIAMLVGVVFHAMIAYSALLSSVWPVADTSNSRIIDFIAWFFHTFRMPLFFLVAGFFACLLVEKRGLKSFLRNRAIRITLPFIVFWPIVTVIIIAVLIGLAPAIGTDTPIIEMIKYKMANPEAKNDFETPPSTTHLWFIYYLTIFCFFAALLSKFVTLSDGIKSFLCSPVCLLLLFPLLSAISLSSQYLPHPAPEQFVPKLWGLTYYGLFFFIGWVYYQQQNMLEKLTKFWWPMAVACVFAYLYFFTLIPERIDLEHIAATFNTSPELTLTHLCACFSCGLLSWYLTLLSLRLAKTFLDWQNCSLRFITDSSYWIYILHIPLLFIIHAFLNTLKWPILIELSISLFITIGFGLLSYRYLVRYSFIGTMLNGKKPNKKTGIIAGFYILNIE